MKLKKAGLVTVTAGFSLFVAGCSGGGGSFQSQTANSQRFAGDYSGAFVGVTEQNSAPVSGVFNGTTTSAGQFNGTVLQDDGTPTFPATGSVGGNGNFSIVAAATLPTNPPLSFRSEVAGKAIASNNDLLLKGTLLTTQSNGVRVQGRAFGIRSTATPSPYAGSYAGKFTGKFTRDGSDFSGNISLTVTSNGLARGTFVRSVTDAVTLPIAGIIDGKGSAELVAVADVNDSDTSNEFALATTQLLGKVATSGTLSGTLKRTSDSTSTNGNGNGTFTVTRK